MSGKSTQAQELDTVTFRRADSDPPAEVVMGTLFDLIETMNHILFALIAAATLLVRPLRARL